MTKDMGAINEKINEVRIQKVKVVAEPELILLSKITDIKLVAELRLRGYEVTAKKIIEL